MALGTRGRGDGRVQDALDRCLARMRQGESLEGCLADQAGLADELRPLLQLAEKLAGDVIDAPAAGDGLAAARGRLQSAAADARARAVAAAPDTSAEPALADALDHALARLALGARIDDVVAGRSDHAEAVHALVSVAGQVRQHVIAPPAPPTNLARGRDRLLVAVADARDAALTAAARADGDASLTDALDLCLTGVLSGTSPDDALRAHPHQTETLAPLIAVAVRAAGDVVVPPVPELSAGRVRLLSAAQRAREARAKSGLWSRFPGVFAPGRVLSLPRMVAACVALVVVLAASGQALAPAAAAALPGDTLYSVKRIGEEMRLALAFDPNARAALEAGYSRERAREVTALLGEGRGAEIDRWQVRFRGFEDHTDKGTSPHGVLHVVLLDDATAVRTLTWDEDTRFDLTDRYPGWSAVPPGIRLVVGVEIVRDGALLARSVSIDNASDPPETETPTPSDTPDGTAETQATGTPVDSPTPTEPSETPTATPATATATPTGTTVPTEAPTVTAVAPEPPDERSTRATLRGVVQAKSDDATWIVDEDGPDRDSAPPARKVTVDVSAVDHGKRDGVNAGDWVQLHGKWRGDAKTEFVAHAIDRVRHASVPAVGANCTIHTAVGRVGQIDGARSLSLVDGTSYDLTALAAGVTVAVQAGARVEIVYRDCGDGRRVAQSVTVLDGPSTGVYQGTVESVAGTQFTLVTRRGTRHTVLVDAATALVGASAVEVGQVVQVRGWQDDDGIIHAEEIRVRAPDEASPTPIATATDVVTAGTVATITPNTTPPLFEATAAPGSDAPGAAPSTP
jgi:hypothetical protein